MFMKNWVQHDQGGGDRTCLQARRRVIPCNPGPRGRRRTYRRLNLRTYIETLLMALMKTDKQANKQTMKFNFGKLWYRWVGLDFKKI